MRENQDHLGRRRRTRRSIQLGVLGALIIGTGTTISAPPSAAAAETEVTAIASARSDWTSSAGQASDPHIAADGRFVAFTSTAFTIVPGVETTFRHVFLHDLMTDEKVLVSHDQAGVENKSEARAGAITKTGSHIAFTTTAKLDPADTNAVWDVYVWTRATDTVELVSKGFGNAQGNGDSGTISGNATISISDDGRYVAFASKATNLVATDANAKVDVFRRDRTNSTTSLISVDGALQLNGDSTEPDMSADGRYVVFSTLATNLPGTDTNATSDVWIRDTSAISPAKVSIGLDANPNNASIAPKVSSDGNLITFESLASDLVANDTNLASDIFVRNRSAATTTRVSVYNGTGAQLDGFSISPDITSNGSRIAFTTISPAAAGDTNGTYDVYVRNGSSVSLRSRRSSGAQESADSTDPSIDSNGAVAWTSNGQFAATDTDGLYDVFVRQSLFIGPFEDVEGFVTTQFARFRGAAPTSGTIAAQAKLIRSGASPTHFIVGLADEAAFSTKRAPLVRLYWAYFKRRPDLNGLNFWLRKYQGGARLVDISQQFSKSSEFQNKYGNTTPEQFVTLVYQNVLERNPDSAGTQYWAGKIRDGMPRGQVMTSFSESSEGKRIIGPRSDAILIALGMYGKIPSQALFTAMVADRQAGWPREIIPAYILGAPEYAATLT